VAQSRHKMRATGRDSLLAFRLFAREMSRLVHRQNSFRRRLKGPNRAICRARWISIDRNFTSDLARDQTRTVDLHFRQIVLVGRRCFALRSDEHRCQGAGSPVLQTLPGRVRDEHLRSTIRRDWPIRENATRTTSSIGRQAGRKCKPRRQIG